MDFLVLLVVIGLVWLLVTVVRKMMSSAPGPHGQTAGHYYPDIDEEEFEPAVAPRGTVGRDIPPLFPDFYHGVLFAVGKEPTPQNLLALVEYVSQMLTMNAVVWFQQTGDAAAQERFMNRFRGGGGDDQKLEMVTDDMIDFLWAWRPSTHQALRDWIPDLEQMLTGPDSRLWRFGDELPFGIWEMND
ncbi:hypothetical protein ACIPSJ_41495 [Streptomyces sp. NPDC090088]|uniref:hypothetical protein n=1 Tax=Streptomyces sp. NPDC090088 TaxID=3365944 RepID=UPI00381C3AB8